MTAILRIESRNRLKSSVILTGVFAITSLFFLAVFPAMRDGAEAIEDAFPEYMMGLFGFEELHTIEGFLGGYVYPFIWVIFGGIYFAYAGAGMIASDIEHRQMDLLLSNPVSRESVIIQTIASIWVPLVVLNVGMAVTLFGGVQLVDESLDPVLLTMVHLLSVPYFLVCAGIGLVFSVTVKRVGTAQVGAIGLVFMSWLIEGLSEMGDTYEWLGTVTPHRYYDSSAILVHEEYAFSDAAVLTGSFIILVVIAVIIFVRRDIQ